MYMKNVMYKIIMGCYIVAALVLVTACNDNLDIQQAYPFSIETLPVPKRLKVGETAEIRCRLVRGGYYQPTTYQIRYFQPDGKGKLEMDNGTVFLPNDLYPLEKETFWLYYTSASTDQQTIDIYIIDSFGQMQQLTLSFNNDNSERRNGNNNPLIIKRHGKNRIGYRRHLVYIETTLETDTVPAVGDIIIMDKDCISERDSAELWKTPSNQVFKWADEEDDAPVMEWFDCDTEMLVNKRTWKYDIEEEETVCILGVKFIHYEDL